MQSFNVTGLIVSIVLVGVVFVASYFFKQRSAETGDGGAGRNHNKGCSVAFYVFMALLFAGFVVAYIMYRKG